VSEEGVAEDKKAMLGAGFEGIDEGAIGAQTQLHIGKARINLGGIFKLARSGAWERNHSAEER